MAFEILSFDSAEYAWKDMTVVMAGRPVIGITGLKWKTARTTTEKHGSGSNAHTIQRGNKSITGTISLYQSEVEALLEAVQQKYGRNSDLTDGVFDITAAFAVSVTSRIKTHQLISVHISEFEMGMMQDDPTMQIDLPFVAIRANYNV